MEVVCLTYSNNMVKMGLDVKIGSLNIIIKEPQNIKSLFLKHICLVGMDSYLSGRVLEYPS